MSAPQRIVIAGAGVMGLAIAWALRGLPNVDGARITIVERSHPGAGASWAGGGILWPLPPDVIDPRIAPLLTRSLELYPAWCEGLAAASGVDPEYWACGARHVRGDSHTDGRRQDIRELQQVAQVRNPRLLQALVGAARAAGIEIIEDNEVTGWTLIDGRVRAAQTTRGDLACDALVLATGAWSGRLLDLGVRPVKGQMLLYRGEAGQLTQIVIGDEIYLVPRRDGHVLVGSTVEDVGFDTSTSKAVREQLHAAALALWPPLADLPMVRQWAGLRPGAPPQGRPLIGPVTGVPGLYVCTGHFRIGLTLAPASAELMAALLGGANMPIDPALYRLSTGSI